MEKRNLRVANWIGTTPAVGFCTCCATTFKVPLDSLKRTGDAQESLRRQFDTHTCKLPGSSQHASRNKPEPTPESANEK